MFTTNHLFLNDLTLNTRVQGYYCANQIRCCTTKAGKPYLRMMLQDRSGEMPAVFWEPDGSLTEAQNGTILYVEGEVSEYNQHMQLTLYAARATGETDAGLFDLSAVVPTAEIDVEGAVEEIYAILQTADDEDYLSLFEFLYLSNEDQFCNYPAGQRMHHARVHGLLEHTLSMLHCAVFYADHYPGLVNRGLLLTGTALHDFGKVREFEVSPLGLVKNYTPEGQLVGHPVLVVEMINEILPYSRIKPEKLLPLKHMLLSHHGTPEHGAAVAPKLPEAQILASIDSTDANLDKFRTVLQKLKPGTSSPKLPGMENGAFRHELPVG